MKRKNSKEPDLYVVPHKLTKEESKEMSEFIEAYKQKQKTKKSRKAA